MDRLFFTDDEEYGNYLASFDNIAQLYTGSEPKFIIPERANNFHVVNTYAKEIKLKTDLPFTPVINQVIYIESIYNDKLNKQISGLYELIYNKFIEKNYTFIYIPKLIKSINNKTVFYLYPYVDKNSLSKNNIKAQNLYDELLSYSEIPLNLSGGLLQYKESIGKYHCFLYFNFFDFEKTAIELQLDEFLSFRWSKKFELPSPCCEIITPKAKKINPEENADYFFDHQAKQLIAEIRERIVTLKLIGINELVVKKLFENEEKLKLSRLLITPKYEIILPDYENIEIVMYPLPKAVFFLFLNHPEGILFKHLPEYRDELIALYKKVSGRENIKDMEKSINDVVNPTLNSINEKCSRIREAFIKHFDESLAQNYFITGERATPKKIMLERELVILDKVELKVDVVKTPFENTIYNNNSHDDIPENGEDDDLPF